MRKYLGWLLAGIVITPIILNFIIGREISPDIVHIAGKEEHWVGFWGSFAGGVLTAIVTFITMYRESKQNVLNIMIANQENFVKELEITLSNCVKPINFSRINSISLWINSENLLQHIDVEIENLNNYHRELTENGNAWAVVYEKTSTPKAADFKNRYLRCLKRLQNEITDMTYLLCSYQKGELKRISFINQVTKRNRKAKKNTRNFAKPAFDTAQEWLEIERIRLKAMKLQTSKFIPNLNIH